MNIGKLIQHPKHVNEYIRVFYATRGRYLRCGVCGLRFVAENPVFVAIEIPIELVSTVHLCEECAGLEEEVLLKTLWGIKEDYLHRMSIFHEDGLDKYVEEGRRHYNDKYHYRPKTNERD